MYLYRAVDSDGNTVEFMLNLTRNAQAANASSVRHCGPGTQRLPA